MSTPSRRRYLGAVATAGATALSGCGGLLRRDDEGEEAELRERIDRLEAENDQLRAELDDREDELDRSEAERRRLETRLDEERNETRTLRERLEDRNAELESLRTRIDAQEARITRLQATISLLRESAPDTRFDETVRESALGVGESVRESVVYLQVADAGRRSHGTGFLIAPDLVVTNSHVVGDSEDITCWTLGGDTLSVSVLGRVESNDPDVAALRLDDGGADAGEPLSTGDSGSLSTDQPLVQVGHPGSFGNWVISLGPFVERARFRSADGGTHSELKTLVPTIPGNSGSPVLTLDGDVVGLTYAGLPKTYKAPDEAPTPAPAKVYEAVAPQTYTLHETIERVRRQLAEWE
ncbi:S1 family peptidase [Halorussus marinus]|uniref:S1 family peptidase n=1 Tax=Halorussus marinus TaxID=2505976 RepID=UPI00106EF1C6|nr:serine protease [Halorussus marinus]